VRHVAIVAASLTIALVATALPFLPGPYDALAVPLSGFARVLGLVSVLLVPVGIVWLLYEWRRRAAGVHRGRAGFVLATLVTGSFAVFGGAAFTHALAGATLPLCVLAAWGVALWWGGPRLLGWARSPRRRDLAVPLTLILAPLILVGAQRSLAIPLTSLAWNRTIDGVTPLIADIERYRATNGRYPRSLFSEWCDYRPAVIGVSRYQYEPSGDGYNLAVEMPSFSFDSREFLVYNPNDTHAMASHDAFLLQRTAAELLNYPGYYSARPLDRPHWALLSYD
jgi:hypothetical protein